ncbi:hypothetical protein D9756_002368 [Leucocoprinus leucothites]|uniref:F-box domain-containing protein n=1 Tax=Leucocoprinus leucothites TaxID=201217 RepID=A0A8H5GBA5_9AGAR|nr:hypothetical protein D9756_002368 [Leucoagaricus leucothites]
MIQVSSHDVLRVSTSSRRSTSPESIHRMAVRPSFDESDDSIDDSDQQKPAENPIGETQQLRETRNELAPISRLPHELLAQVFVYLRKMYPVSFERSTDSSYWLHITRVCRRWRTTAFDCPNLWAFISLEESLLSVRIAKEMLKRSKMAPLTVTGHLYNHNLHLLENITKEDFHRIQVLDIYCDRPRVEDFRRSFLVHLSSPSLRLESLRLGLGRGLYSADHGDKFQVSLPGEIISKAPCLREVDLTAIGIQWESLSLCTHLCSLKLDDIYPRPTLFQVLDVLRAAPLLRVISLAHSLPDQRVYSDDRSAIRLDHLQSLTLEGHLHDCALLLSRIQHPSATRLKCHFRTKGGAAIKLNHIKDVIASIADRLRNTSSQPQSPNSLITIQSARLGDSSGRGMDIYLFDQPLRLSQKPSPFLTHLRDAAAVVISFDSSFPWTSCAHATTCLFTTFDLSRLYSLDICCGSYKLPPAEILCTTFGSLPHLEEIKLHEHLRGALKDALLRDPRTPSAAGIPPVRLSPPATAYFPALKIFVFENGDFGNRKNDETMNNLEKIFEFRNKRNLPIKRLVLNNNRCLRDWRLRQFLDYVVSVEVDGEIVEESELGWDTEEETVYSDPMTDESYLSSDS